MKNKSTLVVISFFVLFIGQVFGKLTPEEVKAAIIKVCHEEKFHVPVMLAICERESDFGLTLDHNLKGDRGHGYGHFQIDDRWHKEWLNTHNWRDPAVSCRYAIKLLRANIRYFDGHLYKAIAAYNCGPGRVPKTGCWDRNTTGRNYSRDVARRGLRLGREYKLVWRR
jgi:hypothetical protein